MLVLTTEKAVGSDQSPLAAGEGCLLGLAAFLALPTVFSSVVLDKEYKIILRVG